MRWSSWLGACVLWTCAQQAPQAGGDCRTARDCPAPRLVEACQEAVGTRPAARELCERAWQVTGDEEAAVSGARHALITDDQATLQRWVGRARHTLQGARILHYWGEMLVQHGALQAAEE
ncbi:MAG TPA: hypothetical protein VHW23_06645, partial [Kofleriaceae bacterium]|nr:hypothetical protein [Kofleriaceae bacterium]